MRKSTTIIAVLAVMLLSFCVSCSKSPHGSGNERLQIDSLFLSSQSIMLDVQDSKQLTFEVFPADAYTGDLVWKSSDESVVNVTPEGLVTPVSIGEAVVSLSNEYISIDCKVTVTELAEYTVMLYGCAGGNLDKYISANLKQAESYGVTDDVKMTALIKFSVGSAEKGAIFYDLQEEGFVKSTYADRKFDLSDPVNFSGFIQKSAELYPAKKYIIITTNHGSEWDPTYDVPNTQRAMIFDDNTNTAMSIFDFKKGIELSGYDIDLVYPDVCLFGMLEFSNELDENCNYVLCTSNYVLGEGGNYKEFLKALNEHTSTADAMNSYMDALMGYWKSSLGGYSSPLDIKLIDPKKVQAVYPSVIAFKERVLEKLSDPEFVDKLDSVQKKAYYFDEDYYYLSMTDVDVLDLFTRIADATGDEVLKTCQTDLRNSFDEFILSKRDAYSSGTVNGDYGFSIGIQWNRSGTYEHYGFPAGYEQSKFDQATLWSELMKKNDF